MFHRHFYALDADAVITHVCNQCPQCSSIARLPKELEDFTTSEVPVALGSQFACDVLCRAGQRMFLLRDTFSCYTVTRLIPNEQSLAVKAALIETTAELISPSGCVVRVDGSTALQSLVTDAELKNMGILVDVGRLKNCNKNPIAEKAIQELEQELRKAHPDGRSVMQAELAGITAMLNGRVRNHGLSSKEIVFQRDYHTGEQLNLMNTHLAQSQYQKRISNHEPSACSQAKTKSPITQIGLSVGDLIYI